MEDINLFKMVEIYRNNPAAAARDLLGIDLAPHQRVILKSMWDCNNVIAVLSRGSGKCETYDNLIQTKEGFKKIGDICTENSQNQGFSEYHKKIRGENGFKYSSHTYINEKKPIYKLLTSYGYEKKAVDKHMIRIFSNGEIIWKRMDEIKAGDYAAIERGDYEFSGKYASMTKEEGYLIGAIIGDGCLVANHGVGYTCADNELIDYIKEHYSKIGATAFTSLKDPISFYFLFGSKENDKKFFEKYGLIKVKSKEKVIPRPILESNNNVLAGFIRGLMDTDGSVNDRGVEFSSSSEVLIKQLQTCLLSFGIISRIRKKMVKYKNERRLTYILTICSTSIIEYRDKIGFLLTRKSKKLNILCDKIMNPNKDVIPGLNNLMMDVRNEYLKDKVVFGNIDKNIKRLTQTTRLKKYNPSYRFLYEFLKLTKECENMVSYKKLLEIYNKGYFFDTIKSIEILPEEVTYDLSIPDDHTFISNGFISHNTYMDAVFAILRAMLYPGEKVGITAPSFRQSKFIFDEICKIYDISPILRDCCTKKPTKVIDLCYLDFKSTGNRPGSVIHCLPLGSGNTIRGARYFTLIVDEAAQVPVDILNVVLRGMMATAKNPMEQVRYIKEQKKLLEEGKIDKIKLLHQNKLIMSSTAFYQDNHLWNSVSSFIKIIMDKAEKAKRMREQGLIVPDELKVELRGKDLNSQIPFNVMKDDARALIAFGYQDMPEGFMNTESIMEAQINMPRYQFLMEYCFSKANVFVIDSEVGIKLKEIQDIKIGDWVWTHKKRYRRVIQTGNRCYTGKMLRLRYQDGDITEVTSDHKFYFKGTFISIDKLVKISDETEMAESENNMRRFTYEEFYVENKIVYDFSVEEDNSFTLKNATVHNCSLFPADSDGFYPVSLLNKARSHGEFTCKMDNSKDDGWITLMGCDPARTGDNFSIAIGQVNIKTDKIRLRRVFTYNKMTFPFMHEEIRKLRKFFNVSEIAMDSGGGGLPIRDLLADTKACPPGDDIILQQDFDEHTFKSGKKILRLVEFANYEWVSNANNSMLLGLQNGTFLLPCEKGALRNTDDYDETSEEESARIEIDKTIEEIQNIVVTRTQSSKMHWDTPTKRQRKDRYSATLIFYDLARSYLNNVNKPQTLAGGFWLE